MTSLAAWPLYCHDAAAAPLLASVRAGRSSHAYLITGPPRIGKGTLARMLAAAFSCSEAEAPCGVCSVCRRVRGGAHPDVETLSAGGLCEESDHDHTKDNSRDVRICQVRRAERLLNLTPFEGRARVVIIDPAGALNTQSADAFLKTLEEPPAQAVIILVTVEPGSLAETIRSRCRGVPLRAAPVPEVERVLHEQRGVPPEQAKLLARLSGGRIGWALAALDDEGFLAKRTEQLGRIAELARSGRADRFAYAEKLAAGFARGRDEVYATLSVWTDWWRDVLLVSAGSADRAVNLDCLPEITDTAARVAPAAAAHFLRALRQGRQDLEANVSPRLALEAMMLKAPSV